MAWQRKNYRIILKNGEESWYYGWRSGYFAHNYALVLTHLASGFQVGQFATEKGCERVGDYLNEHFAAELAAIKSAIGRKKPTTELINQLPEMTAFLQKCKDDAEFLKMMDELQLRKEEITDDECAG